MLYCTKETNCFTFNAILFYILEYANAIWSLIISNFTLRNCKPFETQLCAVLLAARYIVYKYKHSTPTMQNPCLFNGLKLKLKFHATHLNHGLKHKYTAHYIILTYILPRNMKSTIFYNNDHTNIINSNLDIIRNLRIVEKTATHLHQHYLTIFLVSEKITLFNTFLTKKATKK